MKLMLCLLSGVFCVSPSGWEGAWCSYPDFRDPSKSACRQVWRSACGRCHPCCQQYQFARCQTQGGGHHSLPAGNKCVHTYGHCTTLSPSEMLIVGVCVSEDRLSLRWCMWLQKWTVMTRMWSMRMTVAIGTDSTWMNWMTTAALHHRATAQHHCRVSEHITVLLTCRL